MERKNHFKGQSTSARAIGYFDNTGTSNDVLRLPPWVIQRIDNVRRLFLWGQIGGEYSRYITHQLDSDMHPEMLGRSWSVKSQFSEHRAPIAVVVEGVV